MKKIILLILLSLTISASFSQKDDWIRTYYEPITNYSNDLIETYDKGYIILATVRPVGYPYHEFWTWIIKTDINGEKLWEKKIGDGIDLCGLHNIHQTSDGGYILSGGTTLSDYTHGDTFFMKLNACGEKEWCQAFHQEDKFDFGLNTYSIPGEDNFIALVTQWGPPGPGSLLQGIWLFKLNNNGEAIWMKNIFDEVQPEAWNELPYQMFLSAEGELIISGMTLYGDPIGFHKPFIVSANFDGTENWWSIIAQNEDWRGEVYDATEDSFGNIYATGWFAEYDPPEPYYPPIHKLDINGNIIFSKRIIDSTEQVNVFCINMVNDSTLDVAAAMKYPGQQPFNTIIRLDSGGNFLFEKQILQSNFGFSNSIKTFDGKFLYVGPLMDGGNIKIHLHKFNSDLEYDTIYTQPFDYDYMCDDLPIISDTIDIVDCDIWTNLPGEIEYHTTQQLVVYPNPAKEKIKVKLPWATVEQQPFGPLTSRHYNLQYFENSILKIYDIYGKQVKEISLQHQQENELEINISTLPTGIYLINLYENKKKMASGKFIVN